MLRRLIPDTLAGRTIVILLFSLGLFHLWSIWIYQLGIEELLGSTREEQFAEQRGLRHARPRRPAGGRAGTDGARAVHRDLDDPLEPAQPGERRGAGKRADRADPPAAERSWPPISPTAASASPSPTRLRRPRRAAGATSHLLLASVAAAGRELGDLQVSTRTVAALGRPRRARLDERDGAGNSDRLDFAGPLDHRAVALAGRRRRPHRHRAPPRRSARRGAARGSAGGRAFNAMQARIRRLIEDRTQTLAAVSHDLKTPLTRLRLRAAVRRRPRSCAGRSRADLDEMEAMIDSTLDFLRGDATGEEVRTVDIASILETICDQLADAGHDVVLLEACYAPLPCRPLGDQAGVRQSDRQCGQVRGPGARLAREATRTLRRDHRRRRAGNPAGRVRTGVRPLLPPGEQAAAARPAAPAWA